MVEKELVREAVDRTEPAARSLAEERARGAVRWSLVAGWRRSDLEAVRRLRLTADILLELRKGAKSDQGKNKKKKKEVRKDLGFREERK